MKFTTKKYILYCLLSYRLFVLPDYCGVLVEQSLVLNRRRDNTNIVDETEENRPKKQISPPARKDESSDDPVTMIYMCATMWHETENEMIQLLKSIVR